MPRPLHHVAIAVMLFAASAQTVAAQNGPAMVSVDGSVGVAHGWRGGEHTDRDMPAFDVLVAIRFAGVTTPGFLFGFEGSLDWQLGGDAICVLPPGTPGGCNPRYPEIDAFNVLVGHQWQPSLAVRVRVLGGPGQYAAHFSFPTARAHSLGVGARTDVGVKLYGPVSATLAARAGWVPRLRGQSYVPEAVMIGLRFDAFAR